MSEEGEALPQMNDSQSTTHPERDPAPFKVHLLRRPSFFVGDGHHTLSQSF